MADNDRNIEFVAYFVDNGCLTTAGRADDADSALDVEQCFERSL